jgi:hypothetical protein
MMLLIWTGFALGVLVWTGSAVAVSALLYWGAGLLGSGEAAQLSLTVTSLAAPLWLTYWVDIEAIHAAFDGIVWTLDSAQQALPWVGKLLTWLLPLTWLLWAMGVGLMLLLAFAAQLLLRRFGRRAVPAPA